LKRFELYIEEDSQDMGLFYTVERAGVPVLRSAAAGMNGTTDAEQLAFAAGKGFVLYTTNLKDFAVLHQQYISQGRNHAGLIMQARRRLSIGEQARRILRIWETLSAEEMVNRYESLSQWADDRR